MKQKTFAFMRRAVAFTFLVLVTACIGGLWDIPHLLSIQPGPLWVRLANGITIAGVLLTIALLAATFLFGRFFCAVLCPLGTCQDVIASARPQGKTALPNLRWLRYGVALVSLLLLAGGWAILFRHLDPFSRFAAMVGSVKNGALSAGAFWGGLLPLLVLVALVLWKRRIYCVSLCPVGTLLGLAAQFGVWRMRVRETCAGCGRCDAICPTGCIDSAAKSVDAERCVLCLHCLSTCPNGSMVYAATGRTASLSRPGEEGKDVPDGSRRRFLLAGIVLSVGAVAIGRGFSGALRSVASAAEKVRDRVLPPGAIDPERFARQCTGCQVCTAHCPTGIIKPSPYGFGPVRLDYAQNGCEYNCTRCNTVCPSGALQPLNLEDKQWLKIGEARVDLPNCRIVKDGIACGLCAKVCPKQAIFMMENDDGFDVPEVAAFHCIGCGVCQATCPVTPKAITVSAVPQQMGF